MVANVVLKPTPTRSAEYQQIGGGAGGSLGEQSAELSQYRTRAASSRWRITDISRDLRPRRSRDRSCDGPRDARPIGALMRS